MTQPDPAKIASLLDVDDVVYMEAVEVHGCGPIDEAEMHCADRLIRLRLIHDVADAICGDAQRLTPLGHAVVAALQTSSPR